MSGGGQEGYRRRIVRIEYEEVEGVGPAQPPEVIYTPPSRQIGGSPPKRKLTCGDCIGFLSILGILTTLYLVWWAFQFTRGLPDPKTKTTPRPSGSAPTASGSTSSTAPLSSSAMKFTPADEEALRLLRRAQEERDARNFDSAADYLMHALLCAEHPALLDRISLELRVVNRLR